MPIYTNTAYVPVFRTMYDFTAIKARVAALIQQAEDNPFIDDDKPAQRGITCKEDMERLYES